MEIQFYGANCISITTKQLRLVLDDNLSDLGGTSIMRVGDVAAFTHEHDPAKIQPRLIIDSPGEYEIASLSIEGMAVRAHMDEASQQTATLYKIVADDIRVVVAGHLYPELSDRQLEAIGTVDVLVIPVGGNGYTLDAAGALSIIKKIEPKLIIPTHYADQALNFPVPQAELQDALKNLAMEPKETVVKLRLKPNELADITQVVVLEKS